MRDQSDDGEGCAEYPERWGDGPERPSCDHCGEMLEADSIYDGPHGVYCSTLCALCVETLEHADQCSCLEVLPYWTVPTWRYA